MSKKSITRLLLVEDNPGDARLLREMLNAKDAQNIELAHVGSMAEAEKHLAEHGVDIVLLDLGLPDAQGLEALRRAHAAAPSIPLVVLTGLDDESLAAQALREGAQEHLIKGQVDARGLLRVMRYAVERKSMEEALFLEKERAQVTLNSIGDAVACTDTSGNITFLNVVAEKMTGWSLHEAAGRPMPDVFRILDETHREIILNRMEMAVGQDRPIRLPLNCILVRRDGFEIAIEDSVAPIHDRQGKTAGVVFVFHDVTTARTITQQMTHSAQHDFLTGLPNRMLLNDRLAHAIALAPRHVNNVAVLFLDLDGFKAINDSLGHRTGDKLLQSVANRLVGCVRDSDTVSRLGGDEFVVVLSELEQSEDAAVTAIRMLQAVAQPHSIDQQELHVTTSIGISVYPEDGMDAETLIKNADVAMYQAKADAHHNYRFYKPVVNARVVEQQSIEESLRRALERQEFTLLYQPKIKLSTGEITGAEALLRWTHPVRGLVAAAEFISAAEKCGLIVPIGKWVLREACKQARAWVDAGLPFVTMAVNVSATEFRTDNVLKDVLATLKDTGLDPSALELELTESVLMKRVEATASILQTLRATGVRVAVDHFGTGYSSLRYLQNFPVDALKIDQSFVHQITSTPDETTIVAAAIAMGQSMKLRVVAAGVETPEELAFLQAHQCDEVQGHYCSWPVPSQQFAKLLETGMSAHIASAEAGSEASGRFKGVRFDADLPWGRKRMEELNDVDAAIPGPK